MQVCRTFLAIRNTVTAVIEPMEVAGMKKENGQSWVGEGSFRNWTIRARSFRIGLVVVGVVGP
jgi:hypothetical protein